MLYATLHAALLDDVNSSAVEMTLTSYSIYCISQVTFLLTLFVGFFCFCLDASFHSHKPQPTGWDL